MTQPMSVDEFETNIRELCDAYLDTHTALRPNRDDEIEECRENLIAAYKAALTPWRHVFNDPPAAHQAIIIKAVIGHQVMTKTDNYDPMNIMYPEGAEWMPLEQEHG